MNRRNAPEEPLGLHRHERQLSAVKPPLEIRREIQLVGRSGRWLRATQTAGVNSEPDVGLEVNSNGSFLNIAACGSGGSVAISRRGGSPMPTDAHVNP